MAQTSPSLKANPSYSWQMAPNRRTDYDFYTRRINSNIDGSTAILIEQFSGPIFWPNCYVMSQYVQAGRSISTCEKVLGVLGRARMWCKSTGRDLDVELRNGNFLSVDDIEQLADFLSYRACAQKKIAEESLRCKKNPQKVSNLERYRARKQNSLSAKDLISDASEKGTRIRWVANYLQWHLDRRVGELYRTGEDVENLRAHVRTVIKSLRCVFR